MRSSQNKVLWVSIGILLVGLMLMSCDLSMLDEFIPDEFEDQSIILHDSNVLSFHVPTELIKLEIDTFGQQLPSSKSDGSIDTEMILTIDGEPVRMFGTISVQGSSTAYWPKKNWTLKFYNDSERTIEMYIAIGESIHSNFWIAKADFIDPTMMRNAVSYTLWDEIVKSRANNFPFELPVWEVDNAFEKGFSHKRPIQGKGYPSVFPMYIEMDGEFYGLSTLLLGHDPQNFNIEPNNPNHVYLEFDARGGYTLDKTWEKFTTKHPEDGSDVLGTWVDFYYPKNSDATQAQRDAIDEFGTFINSEQENFKENFDTYLDKTNMIDMYLYLEMIYDWDEVAQDIEIVTYDLKKWYLLPWDKDTTFGMWFDNTGLVEGSEKTILFPTDSTDTDNSKIPWLKTYAAFTTEIEARYGELRRGGIFSVANLNEIISSFDSKYSSGLRGFEEERWMPEGRKTLEEIPLNQLLKWFEGRLETLDNHFNFSD